MSSRYYSIIKLGNFTKLAIRFVNGTLKLSLSKTMQKEFNIDALNLNYLELQLMK